MGQTTSRHHEPPTRPTSPTPSPDTNAVAGASADPHSNPSVDPDLSTSDGSGSRQPSLRKNIFKYMKPSSVRNRLGGAISNQHRDARRSWRSTRQCSEAPVDSSTLPSDSRLASSSNSLVDDSVDILPPDKGKQREITPPSDDREVCATDSAGDEDPALQLSNAIAIPEQSDTAIASISGSSHAVDDGFVDPPTVSNNSCHDIQSSDEFDTSPPPEDSSPVYEWESSENVSQSEPQPSLSPQQSNDSPARPFPPPGTLVVVQGIVHTTDVSRSGNNFLASHPSQENTTPTSPSPLPPSGAEPTSEPSTSRARNRLSALLRPRSASSRPRSIAMNDSMPAVDETAPLEAEFTTISPPVAQTSQAESSHDTLDLNEQHDTSNEEPLGGNAPSSAIENRPPSISSSSIDVLGTLLSVAAAATAASLLTGSSEPILSSGLAPPGSNPSVPSSPIPLSSPLPTSTTLPNSPPYPSSPPQNAGISDITAAGRAERMRQAWSTIRERLGLRPSATQQGVENMNESSQDSSVNNSMPSLLNGDPTSPGAPTDTRELMLAEMARAFNIGLGLNGLSSITPNTGAVSASDDRDTVTATQIDSTDDRIAPSVPEGDGEARTGRTNGNPNVAMPAEGSFERFLVDLQIDLRAALTQTEVEVDNNREQQRQSQSTTPHGLSTTTATGPSDNDISLSPTVQSSLPATTSIYSLHESGGHRMQDTEVLEAADDGAYTEMPPLREVSDSESEFDEDDDEGNFGDDDELHSVDHGSTNAASPSDSSNSSQTTPLGSGRIDASGRINWWRLYRFPPVPSPRTGPTQQSNSTPQFASSPLEPGTTSDPVSAATAAPNEPSTNPSSTDPVDSNTVPLSLPPSPPSSSSRRQTSIGGTPLSQIPLHAVVPVIVVGLQSVNQEWRHDIPPHGPNEGLDFVGQPSTEDPVNDSANENPDRDVLSGLGIDRHGMNATQTAGDGQRGSGRTRGWHSRAANAIRNLRSGRRNAETGSNIPVPLMAPGSRTFLIYVIGGYYPPDHSIVTGGPNILDSFEALLELADLLGQVKPPTVSKEDIERSGLKIVKASELGQLEKQGEVASNCLDRCLICLDDYDAEDPIRIMSCRHAFHKGCVDEWLQKGRNNCPACRSTGVATDSHSTSSMPTPAS